MRWLFKKQFVLIKIVSVGAYCFLYPLAVKNVEKCQKQNYNLKYEILSQKLIAKIENEDI